MISYPGFKLNRISQRIGISIIVILAMSVAFSPHTGGLPTIISGTPSPVDITASISFTYIDRNKTGVILNDNVKKISPVFRINPDVKKKHLEKINDFFMEWSSLNESDTSSLKTFIGKYGLPVKKKKREVWKENFVNLNLLKYIVDFLYDRGITTRQEIRKSISLNISNTALVISPEENQNSIPMSDFFTLEDISKKITDELNRVKPGLKDEEIKWTAKFIIRDITPNAFLDKKAVDNRISDIKERLKPVMVRVQQNENIVRKGALVTPEVMDKINSYRKSLKSEWMQGMFSGAFFGIIFLMVLGTYLYFFKEPVFNDTTQLIMLALLAVIYFLVFIAVKTIFSDNPYYLLIVPLAGFSISTALLINPEVAVIMTFLLAGFTSICSGELIEFPSVLTVGGLTAIIRLSPQSRIKNRKDIIWSSFWAGLLQFFVIIVFSYFKNMYQLYSILREVAWNALSCFVIVPMVALFIITVFEEFFQTPTHFVLLEYSQLNAKIFREMFARAPGTYQHTLNVANLSETAAEIIGADSLLTRVGAYYHDIGKINKPSYFTENQIEGINKHDDIKPTLSASILKAHVKDGIQMAKKLKLPQKIIDFIPEHHGTTSMQSFYYKAMESTGKDPVNRTEFKYPGPNPKSRETAIVMLADSVEAVSRAMEKPTQNTIQTRVREIINNKYIEGVLNESNLTLRELNMIADSFIHSLYTMHHTRERYPEQEEIKEAEARREKNS